MQNAKNMTRAWAEIDLAAIRQNFSLAKNHAAAFGASIMAVVKANAYGHGAVKVAKELENRASANFFAVATFDEAAELSLAGIKSPILILSEINPALYSDLMSFDNIIPSVFRYENAKELSDVAVTAGRTCRYYLVLDTGMSRIGLECTSQKKSDESLGEILRIASLENLTMAGVFSHYARADELDKTTTHRQSELFDAFTERMKNAGINVPIRSLCNSAAITESSVANKYDLVRQGISLYGLNPSDCAERVLPIKPAMALRARITDIKTVEAGVGVSYGHTYITDRETVVATLPIGYADGYPRLLSNKGGVLIDGKLAPLIGRICMDQLMVDVTDIPSAKIGSVATLMGADDRVRADRIAELIGTISYEILCGISPRIPRIYVNEYGSINEE